jgi:hypothetical protein
MIPNDDNEQNRTQNTEQSNIDLIYTYTESVLKSQIDSLGKLDTRLATLLAFSGVLLKLVFDLPLATVDPAKPHLHQVLCQGSIS